MALIEKKLSKFDGPVVETAQVHEADSMQHFMTADSYGPVLDFAKLRDQMTETQKSASRLALESDVLHVSLKENVTQQAGTLEGRLNLIENQLSGLVHEQGNGLARFEDRMAGLEEKVDSLSGIEAKLDSLLRVGGKLDGLAGIHEKLDSFAGLNDRLDDFAGLLEKLSTIEARRDGRSDDKGMSLLGDLWIAY